MAYWITLKTADVRNGFSAATAEDALSVLEAKLAEGYEEVRIIHPDGYVKWTSRNMLSRESRL